MSYLLTYLLTSQCCAPQVPSRSRQSTSAYEVPHSRESYLRRAVCGLDPGPPVGFAGTIGHSASRDRPALGGFTELASCDRRVLLRRPQSWLCRFDGEGIRFWELRTVLSILSLTDKRLFDSSISPYWSFVQTFLDLHTSGSCFRASLCSSSSRSSWWGPLSPHPPWQL